MKYLMMIWADGLPAPKELAFMQRELPAYIAEMDRRGVRLLGRELDLPQTAAAVRVRDGETLVSDGPFAETKEFVAGFDVLECDDLDAAVEVAATCPISRCQPIEIRPFRGAPRIGAQASAFGRGEDGETRPYLLCAWIGGATSNADDDRAVSEQEAWRADLQARGVHVLGGTLGGVETARTVRDRDGRTQISDGSFTDLAEWIGAVDVVSCTDRGQAIDLAAAHPLARTHAIEVRPFYCE